MFAIPGMGIWSIIWPFIKSFVMMVIRPFLDPMNWIGLLVVMGVVYGYGYWKGDAHGDRQCAAASLKVEIARLKLEKETAKEAQAQEDKDTAELLSEKEKKEKSDADLIAKLRKRPDRCLLGSDAKRL